MTTHMTTPMTTTTVPVITRARDLLAAEWTKVRSLRSTYLTLLGAAVVTLAVGTFAASRVAAGHDGFFDPVEISLSGSLIVQLAFAIFGALAITSEHTSGMIRTTFAACPRRRAVLAAKATVIGAIALVTGELIAFAAFFLGRLELTRRHLNVDLGDPGVLRAVAGAGFYLFAMALIGLSLGVIIRHTAGTLGAIGLVFLQPLLVLPSFPRWVGDTVLWWAGQAIMSSRPRPNYGSAAAGFGVCAAYTVILLAVAAYLIERRDA